MKILLASICLLACSITTQAQIIVGAHTGYTRAWQDYGNVQLPENAITHIHSYHLATSINYQLNKRFSIAAEPGYANRGAACVPGWQFGTPPSFNNDTRLQLDYIDLPILLQTHFQLGNGRFEVVPSLGYSTSLMVMAVEETIDLETKKVVNREQVKLGNTSRINAFDHGAKGGLRIAYNLENYQIYAKTSMYMGLRNVEVFNVSKNRALDLSMGCLFSL